MPIEYTDQFWKQCWASRQGLRPDLKGAVLTAGLGKRLDPLTAYHLPKPLFPLGGKVPIAETWARRFISSGITDVTLNLCLMADAIKHHFNSGAKFGLDLTYVEEEVPSGTLGGVCKMALGSMAKRVSDHEIVPAMPPFTGSTLLVPSGDIVANFGPDCMEEMYAIHRASGAALTIVLTPIEADRRKDFGTAVLKSPERRSGQLSLSGAVQEFREKDPDSPSCLNNASIYMIEMDLLRMIDAHRTEAALKVQCPLYDFGKHLFPAMLGQLDYVTLPKDCSVLWGIQFDGRWFDVGNKRDYLHVNQRVLDGDIDVPLTYEKLPWGYLGKGVAIDFSAVKIRPPVVIGNDCKVERGAILGPYAVIGDGWNIERGAHIENSVLWERYPYYVDGKHAISIKKRLNVDWHEVRAGVHVKDCIIAGGRIEADTFASTVDVREDGEVVSIPLDYFSPDERP